MPCHDGSMFTHEEVIQKTVTHIQDQFANEGSGHDWWHIYRVWKMATRLAEIEQADMVVTQLGALLHDIADWKAHDGDETAGPKAARAWLESLGVDEAIVTQVSDIVAGVSFKGAGVEDHMTSKEGMIVQDADRLDAIGAIGVARAFAYGGHKGRLLHDPTIPPQQHENFDQYKKSVGTTINHFYEKLLLLKDRMHTKAAKEIAAERHAYLEQFLKEFLAEWEGQR